MADMKNDNPAKHETELKISNPSVNRPENIYSKNRQLPFKDKSLLHIWNTFKEKTSSHGIPQVDKAGGTLKRLLWSVVALGCLGFFIYHVTSMTTLFLSYNVDVAVDLVQARELVFPAVTVCNMNPVRLSAIQHNAKLLNILKPSKRKRKKRAVWCPETTYTSGTTETCFWKPDLIARTFSASQTHCATNGGKLAIIDTLEKHNHLVDYDLYGALTENVWINLRRVSPVASPGDGWLWEDITPVVWTNWDDDEPSIDGDVCVSAEGLTYSLGPGKWEDDMSCTTAIMALCQKARSTAWCPEPVYTSGSMETCFWMPDQIPRDFSDSKTHCATNGGELAIIDTLEKHNHIVNNSLYGANTANVWINLQRGLPTDGWLWEDITPVVWDNWDDDEPSTRFDMCVSAEGLTYGNGPGKWEDEVFCITPILALCHKQRYTGTDCDEPVYEDSGIRTCFWKPDTVTRSFDSAKSLCQSFDAKLAIIDSEAKHFHLLSNSIYGADSQNSWINLRRASVFDPYLWADVTPLSYTNWRSSYPENITLCAFAEGMWYLGGWENDVSCTSTTKNIALCEKEIPPETTTQTFTTTEVQTTTTLETTSIPTTTQIATTTVPLTTTVETTTIPLTTTVETTTTPLTTTVETTTIPVTTTVVTTTIPLTTTVETTTIPVTTTVETTTIPLTTTVETTTTPLTTTVETTTIPLTTTVETTTIPVTTTVETTTIPLTTTVETTTIPLTTTFETTTIPLTTTVEATTIPLSTTEEITTEPVTTPGESTTIPVSTIEETTSVRVTSTIDKTTITPVGSTTIPGTTQTTVVSTTTPLTTTPASTYVPDMLYEEEELFQKQEEFLTVLSEVPEDEKKEMGHQRGTFILGCAFGGKTCTDNDFSQYYNQLHGNCYIYNSGWKNKTLEISSRTGRRYGLKLILNIQQHEYVPNFGESAGARIIVLSQSEMPFPQDTGVLIKPGELTSIRMEQVIIKRMSEPYGTCHDGSKNNSDINVFEEHYPTKYSSAACFKTCYQQYLTKACGCRNAMIPTGGKAFNGTTFVTCTSNPTTEKEKFQASCMEDIEQKYIENKLECNCLNACSEKQFDLQLSTNVWPSDVHEVNVLDNLKGQEQIYDLYSNSTALRKNLMKVEVYFEDFNHEMIYEKPAYEMTPYMSDLGGILGLWIGCSVVSIFEFVELFADLLAVGIYSLFCSKRKPSPVGPNLNKPAPDTQFADTPSPAASNKQKTFHGHMSYPDVDAGGTFPPYPPVNATRQKTFRSPPPPYLVQW